MSAAVHYVMSTSEEDLVRFFLYFGEEKRKSVFRRLARLLHPDKNSHLLAKEAF